MGRDAACQGCVIVNVEFEEMEEGVVYGGNGAIDLCTAMLGWVACLFAR